MRALNKRTGQLEKVYVKALDSNPVGSVMKYLGTIAPKNYLLLDGEIYNINQYPQLANLIKDTFGSYNYFGGNGTTTFGLPDMRGRVPVGVDVRDVDFEIIGKTGGEKTHTLTINEIPDHNHAMNNFSGAGNTNQFHTVNEFYSYHGDQSYWNYNNPNVWTSRAGGGQAHNNLQPYMAWNFIIKAVNTTPTGAHIVDGYSTSTTDGYSCNEANTLFQTKGQVLWTNSTPTSNFGGQTITLSSNDYDYIEIIYNNYKSRNTYESTRVYKEYPASEIGGTFNYGAKVFTGTRPLEITNNGNKISFENAYGTALDTYSFGAHQDWYIPIKIIGYKN